MYVSLVCVLLTGIFQCWQTKIHLSWSHIRYAFFISCFMIIEEPVLSDFVPQIPSSLISPENRSYCCPKLSITFFSHAISDSSSFPSIQHAKPQLTGAISFSFFLVGKWRKGVTALCLFFNTILLSPLCLVGRSFYQNCLTSRD